MASSFHSRKAPSVPQALRLVPEAKLGRTFKKKSVWLLNFKALTPNTILEVKAKNATVCLAVFCVCVCVCDPSLGRGVTFTCGLKGGETKGKKER